MKRRLFVKASILSTSLASIIPTKSKEAETNAPEKSAKQEFYELRTYTLKNETQEQLVQQYFQSAAIPALNRLGSKNVGVFKEMRPQGQTRIFVIIPYKSVEDFMKTKDRLSNDATYMSAASAYLNAPATEPAYDRIESSLLKAFAHMPKLEIPEKKDRIFELRRYESASENAGKTKIAVFNDAGEIDIFKKVGLTPVFFGETIIGSMMPNLTYMITFDDMAEHDRNWKTFGGDPKWKEIKAVPEYADAKIVSRITATFLVPYPFSQI
jgi:hypothetical protein